MITFLTMLLTTLLAVRRLNESAEVWVAYAESVKTEKAHYNGVLDRI